ncbi:MAG: hypothetical protein EOP48_29830, partial [Sphingobacteriales bacterium]
MKITCPSCGTVYNDGIRIVNSTNVTLHNNTSVCPNPNCRRVNTGISGTFDFDSKGIAAALAQPEISRNALTELKEVIQRAKTEHYTPEKIVQEIRPISKDFSLLLSKPKNLIVTVLPVAPPQVRPTVDRGGGMFSEDDLTYQYQFILKSNIRLRECIEKGEPSHVVREWLHTLQFYVTTFSKNDYPRKSTHKNGRPIKSIRDRISSKEGRIRGNLMGKRVDFSARTVISPDPNLALDELGVPRSLAANLTFPEQVTQRNHDFLTGLVKKDTPWRWPGAKYVRKKTGEIFDLRIAREINLEIGDIVERHI